MKAQSDEHEKILQIQTFESNAAHQAAISDLNALHQLAISGLNAGHQLAISELRAILNGCDIKIEALQDQLHPYLQGSRHTQMMSQFRERDAHQITDARVANYYSDMNLQPAVLPVVTVPMPF